MQLHDMANIICCVLILYSADAFSIVHDIIHHDQCLLVAWSKCILYPA